MASVGHVIVGACAARLAARGERGLRYPWTSMIVVSGLSLLPDIDVLGFRFGIEYEHPFGHRGFTHSILFALAVALASSLVARVRREKPIPVFVLILMVVLSHGLLDMLTDGGLGVALFWPSDERYFFPWRPIPVAPIGRGFVSVRGLTIAFLETLYFSPLVLLAAWPRLRRWS